MTPPDFGYLWNLAEILSWKFTVLVRSVKTMSCPVSSMDDRTGHSMVTPPEALIKDGPCRCSPDPLTAQVLAMRLSPSIPTSHATRGSLGLSSTANRPGPSMSKVQRTCSAATSVRLQEMRGSLVEDPSASGPFGGELLPPWRQSVIPHTMSPATTDVKMAISAFLITAYLRP